jgi:hypothetical protein
MRRGFWQQQNIDKHIDAIIELQRRIATGADLAPLLSDRIQRYGYVRPKIGRNQKCRGVEWRDKDYALNAYGVHHLHLGLHARSGRSTRTKELLYLSFARDSALFLMVGDHGSFDDGTLAQAVAEAHAASGDVVREVTAGVMTPQERTKLQRSGVNAMMLIGDTVVMPGLLSTSGTSAYHSMHADRMMGVIERYEIALDLDVTAREWFELAGRPCPAAPEFEWMLNYCDLGVLEKTTGTFFLLLPWRR